MMMELRCFIVSFLFLDWNVFHAFSSSGDLQMAMDIEGQFCPDNSLILPAAYPRDLPVEPPRHLNSSCCLECSDNINSCVLDDSCCLGAFRELPTINESISRVEVKCDYPQLKPYDGINQANAPYPTKIIQGCHQDSFKKVGIDVVRRCETKNLNLINLIPVTDPATLKTYRNKYCAQCHGVSEETFVYWPASVQCKYGDIQLRNRDDIINDVMKSDRCNMVFDVPSGYQNSISRCFKPISTCNETGNWKTYDMFIEQACLAYTKIYNFRYRNVFCYMCNTYDIEAPSRCVRPPGSTNFYSFSAVISLSSNEHEEFESSDTFVQCSRNQIIHPVKKLCLNITCQFPKTVSDGTCVNMVDAIGGVIFDVYFELTPHDPNTAYLAIGEVSAILPKLLISEMVKLGFIEQHVTTQTFAIATTGMNDMNVSSSTLEKIVYYLEITFAKTYPVSIIDYILANENITMKMLTRNFGAISFTINLSPWYRGSDVVVDIRTDNVLDTLNHTEVANKSSLPMSQLFLKEVPTTYHLNKFSSCALVTMHDVTVFTNTTPDGKVFFPNLTNKYNVYIKTLESNDNLNDMKRNNISFYICLETLNDKGREFAFSDKDILVGSIAAIILFCCYILSMISALCTFVVYCLFKELRTQPGINNMLLALYLFIAQALFLVTIFRWGKYKSDFISTVIKYCRYFSCLTYAMWTNVCCIHALRVFKLTRTQTRGDKKLRVTVLYTLYCWLIASLPVLVDIVLSKIHSDGTYVAYNDDMAAVFVLFIPLFGIVVINMVLYGIAVIQIRRASVYFEHQGANRNLLLIYLRLYTITGGTLLLSSVWIFTDEFWLMFLSTLCVVLQGFFIFLAFIVNRRVYKLMTSLCKPAMPLA